MPLQRRLPKRGFRALDHRDFASVNLVQLERFADGTVVDPPTLVAQRIVRKGQAVKILGKGELTKKLTIKAHAFSAAARNRIEALGGAVEVVPRA
jgi:large subunit ribosomal protein L15